MQFAAMTYILIVEKVEYTPEEIQESHALAVAHETRLQRFFFILGVALTVKIAIYP